MDKHTKFTKEDWRKWYAHKSNKELAIEQIEREQEEKRDEEEDLKTN